jgi:hypothetical protein
MKEFYNAKDIQKITECSQTKAYDIIRLLRARFEKEYPEAITIQGKIPIWYFNEKILCKKEV